MFKILKDFIGKIFKRNEERKEGERSEIVTKPRPLKLYPMAPPVKRRAKTGVTRGAFGGPK